MKKSLLLILASLFAVFSLTACADEDKNDTAGEVNPASEYVGTYDVTFFATKPYDSNNHAMDTLVNRLHNGRYLRYFEKGRWSSKCSRW